MNAVQLTQQSEESDLELKALRANEIATRKEWNAERDRHEPGLIRSLRERLGLNASIKQIFDPWYMDADTADKIAPIPNEQRRSNPNERLHNNHLHITVREPKIL